MTTIQGAFKAYAKEWQLGVSESGKEFVAVLFEVSDGEHAGKRFSWRGFFTEKTTDRTLDSLRYCGWSCDNIAALTGMGSAEVDIVVEPEVYEGKTYSRVKWVNKPSSLSLKGAMNEGQAAAFAAKMRGLAMQHKQRAGVVAPTRQPTQATRSNGRAAPGAGDFDAPPDYSDDIPF